MRALALELGFVPAGEVHGYVVLTKRTGAANGEQPAGQGTPAHAARPNGGTVQPQ